MPIDFERLQNEVSDCRALLLSLQSRLDVQPVTTTPDIETPLGVKKAAEFLGLAPQTIYQQIKKIPHKRRHGKLYFFASELRAYLDGGDEAGREYGDDRETADLPFGPAKREKGVRP